MTPRRLDPSVVASFGLSALIVGAAAVVLRPVGEPTTLAVAARSSPPAGAPPRPAPAPEPEDVPTPEPPETPPPEPAPTPMGRPESGFTTSLPGESIADVAARLYGPAGSAEALWRANRDRLEGPDAPIRPGTLLRTY